MKLKPLLFLAAAGGAAAAVIKRQGGAKQVAQSVPQPVRDAAQQAGATVQRAVENAPAPVQQAVDKVSGGSGSGGEASPERYEPPIEGLAQPPAESGGAPSDAPHVTTQSRIVSEPGTSLNEPEHAPPAGSVMPDMSDDDPLVREQMNAAMSDAGAIGGNVDELAADDASFPEDPATRPVIEGSGDETEETFETREDIERGNREI